MKRKSKDINIFSISALDLFASGLGAFVLIAVIALPYYLKTDRGLMAENNAFKDELQTTQAQLQQCQSRSDSLQRQNQELQQRVEQLAADLRSCQSDLATAQEANQRIASLQDELQQCQANLGNAQQHNSALQDQLDQMEQSYQSCQRKLRQTFLAVIMQWPESATDVDLHVITPEGYEFYYGKHNRDGSHYPSSAAKLSRDTTRGPGVEVWEIPIAKVGTYKIYYKYFSRNGGPARVQVGGNIYTNKGSHAIATTTLREGQYQQVASVIIGSNGDVSFR